MIDSHCHLDFPEFSDDLSDVIDRARSVGVSQYIIPGVAITQWNKLKELSTRYSSFVYGLGVHPWWVSSDTTQSKPLFFDSIAAHLKASGSACVAIGECGLDKPYGHKNHTWDVQKIVFRWHLQAAQKWKKPLIVHCVKAQSEIIQAVKEEMGLVDIDAYRAIAEEPRQALFPRGVIHAFHGSYEQAREFIKYGFLLGAGGGITYDRAQKTRDAFARIPLEHIVLETDSPSMPPQGRQGERNLPENLVAIAYALSEIKSVPIEKIRAVTMLNTQRLFKLQSE